VLGASTLGAAELTVFVVGFEDAAGELHAARAAIIARATKSRLNIEYSSAASADGMPALGLGTVRGRGRTAQPRPYAANRITRATSPANGVAAFSQVRPRNSTLLVEGP
jgi:hypothetical protein